MNPVHTFPPYGGSEERVQNFSRKTSRRRPLQRCGDIKVLWKLLLAIHRGKVIQMAQDTTQWRHFVNTVIKLRIPKKSTECLHRLRKYKLFNKDPKPWS
jgi:hypothetical protein